MSGAPSLLPTSTPCLWPDFGGVEGDTKEGTVFRPAESQGSRGGSHSEGLGPARLCGGRTCLTQEGHSLCEEMGNEHPLSNLVAQTESRKGVRNWEDQ